MKKHIIISGVPRAGKSTLSHRIATQLGYQHISMDSIIAGFEACFPETGVNTYQDLSSMDTLQVISGKIAPFIGAMCKSGEYGEFDEHMVIDVYQLLPCDFTQHINPEHFDVFYLITSEVTPEERFEILKKYDTPKHYSFYKSESELREGCEHMVEQSKLIKAQCEQYGLPCFETAREREAVLDGVIEKIRERDEQYSINLTSEHFDITYPAGDESAAKNLADNLEESYIRISTNLQQEVNTRIPVILHVSLEDFHKAIGWDDAPEWVCGIARNGRIELALNARQDILQVAVHELAHIITAEINSSFIPAVISEGVASYEAGQNQNDFIKTLDQYPSLDELFSLNSTSENMYAFAYSFVAFIIENYGYKAIILLLKMNYQKNELDFHSMQEIYSSWIESITNNES